MIYLNKDICEYYSSEFSQMYHDLKSVKKDDYASQDFWNQTDQDRIVIKCFGKTDIDIWRHFFKIIKQLDIPTPFINVVTNDAELYKTVNAALTEIIPGDDPVQFILQQANDFKVSNTACVYPFSSIYINPRKEYGVCCKRKENPINNKSIYEIFNNQEYNELRADLLAGKQPSGCNNCWIAEQNGGDSMRTIARNLLPKLHYGINYKATKHHIRTLDIETGNVCNLKCRICNSVQSSQWVKENGKNEPITLPDYIKDKSSELWEHLYNNLDTLEYIHFHGGEPLLDRTHWLILDYLIEQGRTDIVIHYNTNGTVYSQPILYRLEHFDNIEISFSIDNLGDRFDYERHGNYWPNVHKNLVEYSKLDRTRFKLNIHTTVSVFNILDLDSVADLANQLGYGAYFNLLYNPEYFSILNIPVDKRTAVINKLSLSENEQIRGFANSLQTDRYLNKKQEFWKNIKMIDARRSEDFAVTYPEMNAILR